MTTTTNATPAPNAAPKQALTPKADGDLKLARAPGAESSEIEGADMEALKRFNKALPPETKRTDKPAAKKKDEEEEEKPAAEKDDEAAATAQQEGGANADDGTLLEADAGAGEAAAGGSSAGSG
ncbi:hypothetical protein, partial [Thauera sp.]|uniref:hypothetical protein n=1 Tax=Thauera sp. TaxID=1905334 RepID=UPI00257A0E8F